MRKQCSGQMNTEATKEENTINQGLNWAMRKIGEGHGYAQERNPSQILNQCPKKASMSSTVLQQSITKVPNSRENNRAGQENLKTMKIESIHLDPESEEEIVYDRSDRRGSNPI